VPNDVEQSELVDRVPDERLLAEDMGNLPQAVGRPEPVPPTRTRARLVGIGATLTGTSLLAGIALLVLGMLLLVGSGLTVTNLVVLVFGVVLLGTHWGWVHVAEATADAIEGRRNGELLERRRQWLETIKPYARYEITTSVEDDGAITIIRTRYRPVATGARAFSFVREVETRESHSAEEPGAAVAERAELLRRAAARDTERERERFEIAADAYETALLGRHDEHQRLLARRAASEALSERINSNLRDPPLVE
jgi:hypothetical protein